MLDAWMQDVRHGLRQLRRAPGVTCAVVATLAVAIGAAATVFSLLNAIVLRQLPVSEPHRLVSIALKDRVANTIRFIPYETYTAFNATQQVFERSCLYSSGALFDIEGRGTPAEATIGLMTPSCVALLGVRPEIGRLIADDDVRNPAEPARVVVLGYSLWQRLFRGDASVVGETVRIQGSPVTVVGVMSRHFSGVDRDYGNDLLMPMGLNRLLGGDAKRPVRGYNIIGRLRADVTLDQARAAIVTAWPGLQASTAPLPANPDAAAAERKAIRTQEVKVDSLSGGFSSLRERYAQPLVVLVGIAATLLFIGCANLSGLLLSRAIANEHVFAVCLALGATPRRLATILLTESLLLSLAGSLAAVPIAWLGAHGLGLALRRETPFALTMTPDARVLAAMAFVAVLVSLVIGVLPAIAAARNEPRQALQRGRTVTPAAGWWTRGLLVTQVALSLVLLVGATLFAMHLQSLRARDFGFRTEELFLSRLLTPPGPMRPLDLTSHYPAFLARLGAIPGVSSAALSSSFPSTFQLARWPTQGFAREHATDEAELAGILDHVSPGFFATLGTSIRRGRDFTWDDRADTPAVAIVNETLARSLFGQQDPIGQRIAMGKGTARATMEIIGVANDIVANLRTAPPAMVFRPHLQGPPTLVRAPLVLLRARAEVMPLTAALSPVVEGFGYERVRHLYLMDPFIDMTIQQERLLAGVSMGFAALAALLVMVGLYGLLSQTVARRTREIGVRMAMGASHGRIRRLLIGDAIVLTLIGIAAGVPCAWWAARAAKALLTDLDTSSHWPLIGAALGFLALGAVAAWLPARRAARIDPMVALRTE